MKTTRGNRATPNTPSVGKVTKQGKDDVKLSRRVTRQSKSHTVNLLSDLFVDSPLAFQDIHEDGTISVAWTPESESILLKAMIEYKLVGIRKHFNVIKVADLLTRTFGFKVHPEYVWDHVNSLYDVKGLEENNSPNLSKPCDFSLPKSFDSIIATR